MRILVAAQNAYTNMTEQRLRHKIIVGVIPFEGNLNLLSGQENRKMINLDHGYVRGWISF